MNQKKFYDGLIKAALEAEELAEKSDNQDMQMSQLTIAVTLHHVAHAFAESIGGLAWEHFGIPQADQDYENSTELPAFLRRQAE